MHITANMGPNGFGNEFVKLAKLMICHKELGIPIAAPYWRTPYVQALPAGLCYTSRPRRGWHLVVDGIVYRKVVFDRNAHRATGCMAVEDALSRFLDQNGLGIRDPVLVEFNDFTPGLESIDQHGVFLHDALRSVPFTADALNTRIRSFASEKLWVGVHIRQGDFRPSLSLGVPWPDNQWNIQIPFEWYDRVCSRLSELFPNRIQFFVTTNSVNADVTNWCQKYDAVLSCPTQRRTGADVVDLLTLAACDLLIGSASWFSGWAIILQPKPWLWYACAHGEPPWGKAYAYAYVGDSHLPYRFIEAAEDVLRTKEGIPT